MFPFEGWHMALLSRDSQISDEPCRKYLQEEMGVSLERATWWRTEIGGWSGGDSQSARMIDVTRRFTYAEGFAPVHDVPPEAPVSADEAMRLGIEKNATGLLTLTSWDQYYQLRGIPLSSPVALLLTFPLTVYYSIERYGEVPVTVARMLKRPLRIHVVGIEKEMNFLDLFKEIGYLLPEDLQVHTRLRLKGESIVGAIQFSHQTISFPSTGRARVCRSTGHAPSQLP